MPITEPTNLDFAIGLLSFPQVAEKLPFDNAKALSPFSRADSNLMLVKRLVARGSLPGKTALGVPGVTIEDLRKFIVEGAATQTLRAQLGIPQETLLPTSEIDDMWFVSRDLEYFGNQTFQALWSLIESYLPPDIAKFNPGFENAGSWLRVLRQQPTDRINVNFKDIDFNYPDLLKAILLSPPIGGFLQMPGAPDFSGFKNMGEIMLTVRLQQQGMFLARQQAEIKKITPISALYSDASTYQTIINGAINAFNDVSIGIFPQKDYGKTIISLRVTFADLLSITGTTPARLAALAF